MIGPALSSPPTMFPGETKMIKDRFKLLVVLQVLKAG